MISGEPNSELWLRHQRGVLADLLERAANELQEAGIRMLVGSSPPSLDETPVATTMHLTPIRYSKGASTGTLELSLRAVLNPRPQRYEIAVGLTGPHPIGTLRQMVEGHADIWQQLYLGNGFWVARDGSVDPLQTVAQLTEGNHSSLTIAAAYLHSALPHTIVEGVMLMGTLYRGLLDEMCGARTMSRHFSSLTKRLGGRIPRLQRLVRPMTCS